MKRFLPLAVLAATLTAVGMTSTAGTDQALLCVHNPGIGIKPVPVIKEGVNCIIQKTIG